MIIERICVATDGSDLAVRAAQMAVLLASTGARRVVAFSVAQLHFSISSEAPVIADLQQEFHRALKDSHAHVETVARIARAHGVACETLTKLASEPGREIISTAQVLGCDLIVMGAHGPYDANTLFTGSVAQHVLAWSSIPVLVLRDPREASMPEFSDETVP